MRSGDYKVSHHVVRTSSPPVSTAVFRFNLSIRVQNKLGCGPASNSAYPRGASSCGIALALTALATCTLSCTVAIISWRLYFKAGHGPVVKERDFAQQAPRDSEREPCLAASSIPPDLQ